MLVLSEIYFIAIEMKKNIFFYKKNIFNFKGQNTKREQGKKVQIGNVQAAKVEFRKTNMGFSLFRNLKITFLDCCRCDPNMSGT